LNVSGDADYLRQFFVTFFASPRKRWTATRTLKIEIMETKQRRTKTLPPSKFPIRDEASRRRTLEKIFDPFYTTKDIGEGTGLGLAVSRRIVEEHGGAIEAENNESGGASFTIYLPDRQRTMKERILIAEDDADMRELLEEILTDAGYETVTAANGRFALSHVENEQEQIDLIVTDVQMPELKGDELLAKVRRTRSDAPVVVITAFGSVENAVEMVKRGAFSYLTKPFATKDLLEVVRAALANTEAARAQARLRREIPAANNQIIGASRPMRELLDIINRAGRSTSNILITGESGTGKELVARAVHDASTRNKNEFVAVNCAAIPSELVESELFGHTGQAFTGARAARAGLFETASGGTLFLDEIGELPLNVQPKLLRVLQEGTIPARRRQPREIG
jgi:transcriptional regulator with PAS, ATPase and Fis domain